MKNIINKKQSNERGATMVEYALIAALVGAVCIVGATKFSSSLSHSTEETGETVKSVATETSSAAGLTVDAQGHLTGGTGVTQRCIAKYGSQACILDGDGKLQPVAPSREACDYMLSPGSRCRCSGGNNPASKGNQVTCVEGTGCNGLCN